MPIHARKRQHSNRIPPALIRQDALHVHQQRDPLGRDFRSPIPQFRMRGDKSERNEGGILLSERHGEEGERGAGVAAMRLGAAGEGYG